MVTTPLPVVSRAVFRVHRLISIPGLFLVVVLLVATAPIVLCVTVVGDVIERDRRARWTRLWALIMGLVIAELGGVLAAGALWVASGFGLMMRREWCQRAHRRLEEWWVGALMWVMGRAAHMRLDISGMDALATGNAVVIARHTSLGDAALPAELCAGMAHLHLRYVLKRSLCWAPCIDLVGHRLPNHFVDRSPDDDSEVRALEALAGGLDERSAVVIFPEGTFHTPERAAKVVARLRETRPEIADRAATLRHLLPPRPGGTLALLDGAPAADVVVIRHVGFERFSSIAQIVAGIPFDEPVEVDVYRIPRSSVPADETGRLDWLYGVWQDMDDWCEARRRVHGAKLPA